MRLDFTSTNFECVLSGRVLVVAPAWSLGVWTRRRSEHLAFIPIGSELNPDTIRALQRELERFCGKEASYIIEEMVLQLRAIRFCISPDLEQVLAALKAPPPCNKCGDNGKLRRGHAGMGLTPCDECGGSGRSGTQPCPAECRQGRVQYAPHGWTTCQECIGKGYVPRDHTPITTEQL